MNPTNNNRVVVTDGEAKARKRRLAWACAGVALLDLILLLLLLWLPNNCSGRLWGGHHGGDLIAGRTDTVVEKVIVRHDTIHVRDSVTTNEPNDSIDDAVEDAGGNVGGYMRFSIIWNQNHRSLVDLDAHAKEPTGQEIAFNSHKSPSHTRAGGTLDVDMIRPTRTGVENIYWENAESLPDGNYRFFIVNYDGGRNHDCEAKLKVGNRTFLYRVPSIHKGSPATIATVTIRNHQMENIEQSRYLVN